MSETDRDDSGRFTERVTEQDILKVFDYAETPVLTAKEVAAELPITREAVIHRLNQMHEKDLVGRKKTGARAVVWWATVAPRLSEETKTAIAESEGELERGETVSLDEMKTRLGIDGDR